MYRISVVVTSRHTRKTSASLCTIVPRYAITTHLLNEILAGNVGAWTLLRCGLCFLLATINVSDGPICRRTRIGNGLPNRLATFTSVACYNCVATVVSFFCGCEGEVVFAV